MHGSLEGPVFNFLHQPLANRIFLNINPFLRVVLTFTQPMMPSARLKNPFLPPMSPSKIPLPIGDPLFNGKNQIMWSAKKVKMIGHQQVIARLPGCRGQPSFTQILVCCFVRQPRYPVFGGDCQQDDVVAAQFDVDPGGWNLPAYLVCSNVILELHVSFSQGSTESRPT